MIDLIKQGVYTGLGILSLTKEKLTDLGNEISKQAKLSEEQTNQLQAELSDRAAQAKVELEAEIDRRINHAMIQIGIVKGDIDRASESAKEEVTSFVDKRIDASLDRLGVARTEDIVSLTKRVELLESKLGK